MLRLRRLQIERFRWVAGPVDLAFSRGTTLIVGLNGTGKTHLLRLIESILRFDLDWLLEEPVALTAEIELASPEGVVRLTLHSSGSRRTETSREGRISPEVPWDESLPR